MLFWYIYRLPLFETSIGIVAAAVLWGLLMRLFSRRSARAVKYLNLALMLVALGGIVYITILRPSASKRELILMPFQSFVEARAQREMYREMLMNVLLFVPFGLTAPFALAPAGKPRARYALIALLAALVLSVGAEAVQYAFSLGRCETDDVICNTFGTAIGTVSWLLTLPTKEKR